MLATMTLSPVFRSEEAVRLLRDQGIWDRLAPTLALQIQSVGDVHAALERVIGERFREAAPSARPGDPAVNFLQDYFFLTLFLSVFEGMGVAADRLPFYARLNFCIMGTITAADNLFDDQDKRHLALRSGAGARYHSILELMCFERLTRWVCERGAADGLFARERIETIQRGLLDLMAEIGLLEGSEEEGVDEIPTPGEMVRRVHEVRGGLLFGLAMVAPGILEDGGRLERLHAAGEAIRQLGTAFQIVDDLTDFEFDLSRRSHNLLVARIHHCGTPEEKGRLAELWAGAAPESGQVEGLFAESARAVLEEAYGLGRQSLETLRELGFWLDPKLAEPIIQAIVGLDGVARMSEIARGERAPG
jgi:hypothetical protein